MIDSQEMCDKAVKCPFVFDSVSSQCKTQEMCDKIVSEDPFKLKYCHGRCKTLEMYNKAADDFLPTLKFVPDWFVTSKIIKKLLTALYTYDDILYFYENSDDVVFSCNEMGILIIDLNNINLDNTNYDEDDPETVIHIRLSAWHIKFVKCKARKKELNEELMLLA